MNALTHWNGKKMAGVTLLGLLLVPAALLAESFEDDVTGLFVFQAGDRIDVSEVNSNFDVLGQHVATYEAAIFVDEDGQVGIGTNEPAGILHIKNETPRLILEDETVESRVYLGDTGANTGLYLRAESTEPIAAIDNPPSVRILTGGGPTYFNGGDFGIGTVLPKSTLDVNGDASFGINQILHIAGSSNTNSALAYAGDDSNLSLGAGGSAGHLLIDTEGNVGIGITEPKSKLEVNDGYLRVQKTTILEEDCDESHEYGRISYEESTDSFFGCKTTGWARLES